MYGLVITLSAMVYAVCGPLVYFNIECRKDVIGGLGVLFIFALSAFAMSISIYAVNNSPYVEECYTLGSIGDISVSECLDVVETNPSYTGQEIIDAVKVDKIVEKTTELDILDRPLKP